MTPEDRLDRLHRDLGLKRLNPLWAKFEIFFGLLVAAGGLVGAIHAGDQPRGRYGPILLMTLGGYLALAGHRSHLYQSNNRLAAHLADLIRSQQPPQPENPQ